ncbi:MAG: D-2-hydroxyacid dehydrogenase [Pseudomonadota bacterium]
MSAVPVQVLCHYKAADRIETAVRARFDTAVQLVRWNPETGLELDGAPVEPGAIQPRVAWFSGDALGGETQHAISSLVAGLPSIEWVQSANAGLDHPGYAPLVERGIRFSKSSAQSIPIAEYVLAYALEHVQDLKTRRDAQAAGEWRAHRFGELWRSTWLIVGYGHIGRNVAKRAKAFDCHTIVARHSPRADEFTDEAIGQEQILSRLPEADFIVLACPATAATEGMVNAAFIEACRDTAVLINVARGALVDEQALLAGLDRGQPARAVLDVFATEPLPSDSPMWQHPRVTVTAHTSNAGSGTRPRGDTLFLTNLERFLAGQEPTDVVRFD